MHYDPVSEAIARLGMVFVEMAANLRNWWHELIDHDCPLLIDEEGNLSDEPRRIYRKDTDPTP